MANYLAIQIGKKGISEMSRIAGVGGNVKKLVKAAKAGRRIIAINDCALACSMACLSHHAIEPDLHFEIMSFGVKKQNYVDLYKEQADQLLDNIL